MIEFLFWFMRYSTRLFWFHLRKNCWKVVMGYQKILNNFSSDHFIQCSTSWILYFVVSFICKGRNQTCAPTFSEGRLRCLVRYALSTARRCGVIPHQLVSELTPARYAWSTKMWTHDEKFIKWKFQWGRRRWHKN